MFRTYVLFGQFQGAWTVTKNHVVLTTLNFEVGIENTVDCHGGTSIVVKKYCGNFAMSKFHNFRRVDDKAKQALNASQPSYR
jgi:hypothetical protein